MPTSQTEGPVKRLCIDKLSYGTPLISLKETSIPEPELYDPTVVLITVDFKGESGSKSATHAGRERFALPRHLIDSQSAYFREHFTSQLRTRLSDVRPWVFRVFVRWLHKGEIYYDSKRIEPTVIPHSGEEDSLKLDSDDDEWMTESEMTLVEVEEEGGVDYDNPVTWPYSWLFELYFFAVAYQARLFQLDIQDMIHIKLIETRLMPGLAEIATVVDRLTQEDSLSWLLAHWFSDVNTGTTWSARVVQTEYFSVLPSSFIGLSLIMRDSRDAARNCSACSGSNKNEKCNVKDHSEKDALGPASRMPCFYHDHQGDKGRKSRCYWRWVSGTYHIRAIDLQKKQLQPVG